MSSSLILNLIMPGLSALNSSTNPVSPRHKVPIKVLLLQKREVFYVSDGHIIIQILMPANNPQIQPPNPPGPFNRIRTQYYNFNIKIAQLFKYNPTDHSTEQNYHSAYTPEFHIQDRMQKYDAQLDKIDFSHLMQVLVLKEWGWRLVNIANTGYYGVVLQVFNYERKKQTIKMNENFHLVIYEKEIERIMENLRLTDAREQVGKPNRERPISMCYYMKNTRAKSMHKAPLSNFVTADKQCKILKCEQGLKFEYVPMGNISGVMRFLRPLTIFSEKKKTYINFNLFKNVEQAKPTEDNEQEEISENQEQEHEDRCDHLHECEHEENDKDNATQYEDPISQAESQSSEEDPLKLIYRKQILNAKRQR